MTEYQLQYLRFLRMTQEFPNLNHRGHEPVGTVKNTIEDGYQWSGMMLSFAVEKQRAAVEREFARIT